MEPLSDVVNQDDKKKATIIFTPNNVAKKGVEEILTLNVKNGEPMGLRCIGSFTEASCVFVQK